MNIIESIQYAQTISQALAKAQHNREHSEIDSLLSTLTKQLTIIAQDATALIEELNRCRRLSAFSEKTAPSEPAKPQMQAGCYIFADQKGFFCPQCYDRDRSKIQTSRINSKLRICPSCRASLKQ